MFSIVTVGRYSFGLKYECYSSAFKSSHAEQNVYKKDTQRYAVTCRKLICEFWSVIYLGKNFGFLFIRANERKRHSAIRFLKNRIHLQSSLKVISKYEVAR